MTLQGYQLLLEEALQPTRLELHDGSAAHQGHEGAKNAGPISHLSIRIQAACLSGLTTVQQHQKIYSVLAQQLRSGALHAVQIQVIT